MTSIHIKLFNDLPNISKHNEQHPRKVFFKDIVQEITIFEGTSYIEYISISDNISIIRNIKRRRSYLYYILCDIRKKFNIKF